MSLAIGLPTGAVAADRRDEPDQRSRMRVLRVLDERADEHEIQPGTTVADCNPGGDPADVVVEVVFESDLDRRVPGWREWDVDALPERLEAFREEWGVDVRSYAFPRGRLEVFSR